MGVDVECAFYYAGAAFITAMKREHVSQEYYK
jgi:hypothetical protein